MAEGSQSKPYIILAQGEEDMSTIISLRERYGNGNLKPLTAEYIREHIEEFVFSVLDGEKVGLIRLFTHLSYPSILEMGSFVKVNDLPKRSGACTSLTNYAERVAEKVRKTVIAITQPQKPEGKDLASHLERMEWEIATNYGKYQNRTQLSPGKILWQKTPKRLDPDSLHSYL